MPIRKLWIVCYYGCPGVLARGRRMTFTGTAYDKVVGNLPQIHPKAADGPTFRKHYSRMTLYLEPMLIKPEFRRMEQ